MGSQSVNIERISAFVDKHRANLSLEIASLISLWCKCETDLQELLVNVSFEHRNRSAFDAQREKLTKTASLLLESLHRAQTKSLWDIAVKLMVWRGSFSPNVQDLTQFSTSERLAFSASDKLIAFLLQGEEGAECSTGAAIC